MPTRKKNPVTSPPEPGELARLAIAFLPPGEVSGPLSTRPAEVLEWRKKCEDAVMRARILLEVAHEPPPSALVMTAKAEESLNRLQARYREYLEDFDALRGDRQEVPLPEVLEFYLDRVASGELRMKYYMAYYMESLHAQTQKSPDAEGRPRGPLFPERDYEKYPGIYEKRPPLERPGLSDYKVDRMEFPVLVRAFLDAYEENKDRWRKEFAREKARETALEKSDKAHAERMEEEARDIDMAEERRPRGAP